MYSLTLTTISKILIVQLFLNSNRKYSGTGETKSPNIQIELTESKPNLDQINPDDRSPVRVTTFNLGSVVSKIDLKVDSPSANHSHIIRDLFSPTSHNVAQTQNNIANDVLLKTNGADKEQRRNSEALNIPLDKVNEHFLNVISTQNALTGHHSELSQRTPTFDKGHQYEAIFDKKHIKEEGTLKNQSTTDNKQLDSRQQAVPKTSSEEVVKEENYKNGLKIKLHIEKSDNQGQVLTEKQEEGFEENIPQFSFQGNSECRGW